MRKYPLNKRISEGKVLKITAINPFLYADVPDPDAIRVDIDADGDGIKETTVYYMVSTTMHFSPGVPVMRSYDLVNWEIVSYVYDQLEESDRCALKNGKNDYAAGSWASSIRYDENTERFFVAFTCESTRKTYIFSTDCIENGKWHRTEIDYVMCYDNSLLFADGHRYIIYSKFDDMEVSDENGSTRRVRYSSCCIRELYLDDITFDVSLGDEKMLIEVTNYENPPQGLWGEGYHAYKINGYYYIFMIQGLHWQRQETVWRSPDLFNGPWEIKKVFTGDLVTDNNELYLPFTGIAQGGIIQNRAGEWYAMLFQDYGSVGRMPVLIPMRFDSDGWPVIGKNGVSADVCVAVESKRTNKMRFVSDDDFENGEKRFIACDRNSDLGITAGLTPEQLEKAAADGSINELVEKNEYGYNGSNLDLVWQWNHNPNNNLWSLTERSGWLRLKAGIITDSVVNTRNVLTQRTVGPVSSGVTLLDYAHIKDGDTAGISMYQNRYGLVGVTRENGEYFVVMRRAEDKGDAAGKIIEKVQIKQENKLIYLRIDCDFTELRDMACFYYSFDGESWTAIGDILHMHYDWPHFVGYRFGLFISPEKNFGGYADFDCFKIKPEISDETLKRTSAESYERPFKLPDNYRSELPRKG